MTGYEYGNTRLRAMRSRLFDRAGYADMMAAGSLDRMLAILADTAYASDVEAALVRSRGLDRLDRALRSNLARSLRKMASFYEGRPRELVDVLLGRWDLRNLRALIRAVGATPSIQDLSPLLVPAGRLDAGELDELATQASVTSLVDLLVAWGIPSPDTAFALLRARTEFASGGDISLLEDAIDRAYSAEIDRVLVPETEAAGAVLRAEIDARNLELALRVRGARRDNEPGWSELTDFYMVGGLRPPGVWAEVAHTDAPETIAELASAGISIPGWDRAVAGWVSGDDLPELSRRLQRVISASAISRFVSGDPLGFDIPLAFTFAKEAETRNLHLIGRGLVHGLPMASVEENLEVAA